MKWLSDSKGLASVYEWMVDDKFKSVFINGKDDVWKAFKSFFGANL